MANDAQAEFWEALAPDWLAAEAHSVTVAGPFGRAAMERLAPRPGERILDIGCGSGPTTIDLARAVAPGGTAVGADISSTLVGAARERATSEHVDNVSFVLADVQDHDFGAGAFDAVYSRFGIMFFADPAAAFANIHRALAPGGRLGFSCWQNVFANEWMSVPGMAVVSVTGSLPPMPGPDEPGPFLFADPDRVLTLLTGAGFADIEVTPVSHPAVAGADEVERFAEGARRIGAVHEALREADDETATRIMDAVRAALREKVVDGRLELAAAAFVVSASRPG